VPQPPIAIPNVYRIRIQKHSGEDVTDTWFNEYDVEYPVGTLPQASDLIFGDLLAFEKALHYHDVFIDAAVVSNWRVGSPAAPGSFDAIFPYAAGTVGSQPNSTGSLAGQGGGPVGGEVCLGTKKLVLNRRRGGRNFYRGCLQKNDVGAEAGGEWVIINNPQFPPQFNLYAHPAISTYLAGGSAQEKLVLVSTHRDPAPPHNILSVSFQQLLDVQLVFPQVYLNKISRKSKR
jgi:hypothetical protein